MSPACLCENSLKDWDREIEEHLKSSMGKILTIQHTQLDNEQESLSDQLVCLPKIKLMEILNLKSPITSDQIKSYVMSKMSDLLNSEPEINTAFDDFDKEEIMKFLNKHASDIGPSFKEKLINFPHNLQLSIESKLKKFEEISNSEIIYDQCLCLDNVKILSYWPFFQQFVDCTNVQDYNVEITISSNIVTGNFFVSDQINNYRYHATIINKGKIMMIICHQPGDGYIVEIMNDDNSLLIIEYDCEYKKSGCQFLYKDSFVRRIDQYQSNLLTNETYYLINNKVSMIIPFKDDQLHGILRIVDDTAQIIYVEMFYLGISLFCNFI